MKDIESRMTAAMCVVNMVLKYWYVIYTGCTMLTYFKQGLRLATLLMVFMPQFIYADDLEQSYRAWLAVTHHGTFHQSKFDYFVEAHARFGTVTQVFNQGVGRVGVGYQGNYNLSYWLGGDLVPLYKDFTGNFRMRYRLWEQIFWLHANNNQLTFAMRDRLEQSLEQSEQGLLLRFRHKMILSCPNCFSERFIPMLADELFFFVNHPDWVTNKLLDQNRLFVGVIITLKSHKLLRVGYQNQLRFRDPADRMSHILLVSLQI